MKKVFFLFAFMLLFIGSASAEIYIDGEDVYNTAVRQTVDGKLALSPGEITERILQTVIGEISEAKELLRAVLLTAVMSGVLRVLSDSFSDGEAAEAAHFCCFAVMSGLAINIFSLSAGYGANVIHVLCDFVTKFEPIFVGLLVSSGAVAQAAAFQPVLAASVYILSLTVEKCILPLAYFAAIFGIVGNISGRISLENLNKLTARTARWILTGVLTIFSAVLALYGFGSGSVNGFAAKGIKFAVGSLVPVVGSLLSDTVETVVSGARILKNAAGTAGMIAVMTMAAMPIVKIWIMLMLLRITAAVTEPFADKRMTKMLSGVADGISSVFSMVITAAMLFVISIGIILLSTGVSL